MIEGQIMRNEVEHHPVKRIVELDIIKVIATTFVVILHVNGYIRAAQGLDQYSFSTSVVYQSLEGIAYIAVHLFVLVGSYIMCQKDYVSLRSILRIWVTTFCITFMGLIISKLCGVNRGLLAVGQSLFPITLRAYGYVSSYVVLMLLAPFINATLKKLKNIQVCYISLILLGINILFPSILPFSGWGEHYSFLFITLYFVAAIIRRLNLIRENDPKIYRGGGNNLDCIFNNYDWISFHNKSIFIKIHFFGWP